MNAVEVEDLSFRYADGDRDALSRVSFSLAEGAALAIVGPNGSGKSTLLKAIVTLLGARSGAIRVFGISTAAAARQVRSLVAFAPADDRCHDWRLSGRANLELFAALFGITGSAVRERVAAATDAVGLHDLIERPVRTYSQGERQRLTLARALLSPAKLLALDEPFRSLDSAGCTVITRIVGEWRAREGGTVIAAGHTLGALGSLCGRAIGLEHGAITRDGPFGEVASNQAVT